MKNRFEVVAVNDTRDFCECCGRRGLKRVVWIRDVESDEVKHFGTTCAIAPAKGFNLQAEIKAAIAAFDYANRARIAAAKQQYRREGGQYVVVAPGHWRVADRAHWNRCMNEAIQRETTTH